MMFHPVSDEVRKSMLETMCHTLVALLVIVSSTVLAAIGDIDSTAWAGACGTAIAASGAVTVIRRSEVDRGNTAWDGAERRYPAPSAIMPPPVETEPGKGTE